MLSDITTRLAALQTGQASVYRPGVREDRVWSEADRASERRA
jgi:hypothetical protein